MVSFLRRIRMVHGGVVLPPRALRLCGPAFADDERFLATAEEEAIRLVRAFGLSTDSRLLDVGCGVGRLPIGILRRVGEIREYRGVDVDKRYLRWCRRHIERLHPSFRFLRLNIENARYNPSGKPLRPGFRFPFHDGEFDIVYLYSVFSHMLDADVRIYLAEFRRLLASSGRLFFTSFAEEGVPSVTVNPVGYRRDWSGPLHCVRYEIGFLRSMLSEAGFRVNSMDHGTETDGQSAFSASVVPLEDR